MKVLAWISAFIMAIVLTVYVLLFSTFGNGLLQSSIEKKIQENTLDTLKLEKFSLDMSSFDIRIELNKNNTLVVVGNYSILNQAFNIKYDLKLKELKTLKKLTQTQLQGSFKTNGSVVGSLAFIKVDGVSDVAKGDTTYHIELKDFNPTSIIAKMKDVDLKTLLYIGNQKSYASADINLDINFKNITAHKLDGNILLLTNNGKLNTKVLKKDFSITIPKNTAFNMSLNATLKDDDIDYMYALNSNLAKISSGGKVIPEPLLVDIKYGLNIKELALLKVLTGADVRGSLKLDGKVKGAKERLLISGKTDFASSKTDFLVTLKDFKPENIQAKVRALKLQNALYMLKQPHYSDGYFDLDVDMSSVDIENLKGVVKSKIYKGRLDSKYLSKTYEFKTKMPKVNFDATTYTVLDQGTVSTKVDFNSNLADLDIKNAKFNLNDNSLESDYRVKLLNLDRFYFISDRHLKGSLSANGKVTQAKDLDFSMHSKVAEGILDVKLHNDELNARLDNMQTLKVLDILLYPKVFDSRINGTVLYNLAKEKGTFKAKLLNGKFTKNKLLDLSKKYAKINLYKEVFLGDIDAKINKENIITSLMLKSNKSSISTKNARLNSKTQVVHSTINIVANKHPIEVKLDGNVNSPDIKVNADELIKEEATKAIKKGINKYFKGLFYEFETSQSVKQKRTSFPLLFSVAIASLRVAPVVTMSSTKIKLPPLKFLHLKFLGFVSLYRLLFPEYEILF